MAQEDYKTNLLADDYVANETEKPNTNTLSRDSVIKQNQYESPSLDPNGRLSLVEEDQVKANLGTNSKPASEEYNYGDVNDNASLSKSPEFRWNHASVAYALNRDHEDGKFSEIIEHGGQNDGGQSEHDSTPPGSTRSVSTFAPDDNLGSKLFNLSNPSQMSQEALDRLNKKKNPLFYNNQHDISIKKFNDSRPLPGTKYFSEVSKYMTDGLCTVIPFFNEPAAELETTLMSLYKSHQYLCMESPKEWNRKAFNVCIIQDGWKKASESMRRYLKKMYPKYYYQTITTKPKLSTKITDIDDNLDYSLTNLSAEIDSNEMSEKQINHQKKISHSKKSSVGVSGKFEKKVYWWDYFKEFNDYDKGRDGSITFVFEKCINNPRSFFSLEFKKDGNGKIVSEDKQPQMCLTLIIKIDNRRKHNSHEWFMGQDGFVDAFNGKYFFCTDAYTMFKRPTLYTLVKYLDEHDKCCGVTGRQRAMNRRQQQRKGLEWKISIEYLLRLTQIFDFELAGCVFNPTYHLAGFLPVLPGPCGLYRSSDALQNHVREWYFEVVNAEPTTTGLVLGNLRIAEDRVLSYASILKPYGRDRYLAFCPTALFYFEAEIDMERFILQRRRWINGTFAGYVYLLITSPQHLWQWNANFFRKLFVFFILCLNLIQMAALVISPALSFVIFQSSLSYVIALFSTQYETLSTVILLVCGIMWIAHVVIHNTNKFQPMIIKFLYGLSGFISTVVFFSLFWQFAVKQKSPVSALKVDGMSDELLWYIIYLMLYSVIAPFVNALLVDRGGLKCFGLVCKTIIPFYISFYLMIPWFSSYAFARCWDLTWGNRPAGTELDGGHGKSKKKGAHGKDISQFDIEEPDDIGDVIGDVEKHNVSAEEKVKATFLNWSKVVVAFMIIINVVIYLGISSMYWKAMIMTSILIATATFMFISMIALIGGILRDMLWCICNGVWGFLCIICCDWLDKRRAKRLENEKYANRKAGINDAYVEFEDDPGFQHFDDLDHRRYHDEIGAEKKHKKKRKNKHKK